MIKNGGKMNSRIISYSLWAALGITCMYFFYNTAGSGSSTPAKKVAKPTYGTLHDAVIAGDIDAVRAFHNRGFSVNALDSHQYTPFMYAIHNNNIGMVQELIALGADVNKENRAKQTPLMWAALKLNTEILALLLDAGAQPTKEFWKYAQHQKIKDVISQHNKKIAAENRLRKEEIVEALQTEAPAMGSSVTDIGGIINQYLAQEPVEK